MSINTTTTYLLNLKPNLFRCNKDFHYPSSTHPVLSQKGSTCASDAIFTILFESDELRPFFYTSTWEEQAKEQAKKGGVPTVNADACILLPQSVENIKKSYKTTELGPLPNASRDIYVSVLAAAKERYERMLTITRAALAESESVEVPRSVSFSDNLWKKAHTPLAYYKEGGLSDEDELLFLGNLLGKNILNIPGIPKYSVRFFGTDNPVDRSVYSGGFPFNVVAFTMSILQYAPDSNFYQHSIGFYKAGGKWQIIDNEIGFRHTIQDTSWFYNVFLPRLFYTLENIDLTKESDRKLHIFMNPELIQYDLMYHFITPGDKSYPNIPLSDESLMVRVNNVTLILQEGSSAPSSSVVVPTTGGGSAVAAVPISAKNAKIAEQTSALTAAIAAAMAKGKKTGGSRRKTRRRATKKRYTKKTSRRIK